MYRLVICREVSALFVLSRGVARVVIDFVRLNAVTYLVTTVLKNGYPLHQQNLNVQSAIRPQREPKLYLYLPQI